MLAVFLGLPGMSHPAMAQTVQSAAEINYPPFCTVDPYGHADGFSVELLRAALHTMGRDVTYRSGVWADVRRWLESGEVEVLPLVGRTPEREAIYDFTFPYMSLHGAIVVRADTTGIATLDDLRGKQVAVMRGDNTEEFLRREDRGIGIHTTATFEQALHELASGRHDAVVIQRLVALRLIQETGLHNLRIVGKPVDGFTQDFCFAVRKGEHAMLALLNEGLALAMADGTYRRLHARWFAALELPNRRIIIGGDHDYPPYEFLDDQGRPAGYNIELARAVAQTMGLNIEFRLGPWSEMVRALEHGEIDALNMFYTPGRDQLFDFSQAHAANQFVAVVRSGSATPPESIEALRNLRLVVQEADMIHDHLLAQGFADTLHVVPTQAAALRAIVDGEFDYAVVVRHSAIELSKRHGWQNLQLSRRPLFTGQYCYAVRKGNSALLAEFSEGLSLLTESGAYRRIHDKWFGIYEDPHPRYYGVLRYGTLIIGFLLLLLLVILLWSWLLRRQVVRRTAELRASEAFTRMVLDNLPVGIAVNTVTPEIRMSYVNTMFSRLYRIDPELLRDPDRFWDVVYKDPATRAKIQAQVLADCASGDPQRMRWDDVPIIRTGEETTYISARNIPIPDSDLMISTVWDVTERKRTIKALRQSEMLLRIAGEAASLGGWSVDLREQRVIWSDQVAAIHEMPAGFSPTVEEGIGFYAPESRERIRQAFAACAREGTPYDEQLEIVTVTGKRRWVRTIGEAVRDDAGAIVRVEGAFQDITDEIQLHGQLQQSQKLESIGRLAGGVAHDFNNMLSVIIGYTDLALRRVDSGDPTHADLLQIRVAANRSAEIVRQLLAFARKQPIAPRILDLNATIEITLKMLRRLIGENIDLAWLPGPGLGPVLMDPTQVDQILTNLCVNARDAIEQSGRITIETENVSLDKEYCDKHPEHIPGEYVQLAVSDDGSGMDKDVLNLIFEPFFTTKADGAGTGLGLPTVYGIVRQNNGFIHVYSEPGKGSTFLIYLPRQACAGEERKEHAAAGMPLGRGETILMVEDEPAILDMGCIMLESLGYLVMTASTPDAALRQAAAHPGAIDLLLTDVVLPGMNGRELAEAACALQPNLRCLYMSGFTADVIARRGVLYEGVQFIQKPFSMRDLAGKVRDILDGGQASAKRDHDA
jgi:PAS domain S-box-containing protein